MSMSVPITQRQSLPPRASGQQAIASIASAELATGGDSQPATSLKNRRDAGTAADLTDLEPHWATAIDAATD